MKNQIIITLGREHGSGGHYIADMIAQELGIKLYDKDSIEKEIVSEGYSEEMIRKMGLYNRMAKGRFRIGDRVADFNTITANLLAFAGDNDKIVPIAAAEAILNVVASPDKTFEIVPGGHAGVFTGSTMGAVAAV